MIETLLLYQYDPLTSEHKGSRPAQTRPDGSPILDALFATPVPPPADIPHEHVARWTGKAWQIVEDHRQHMDEQGTKQGGTPYWLPDDDWRSPERYMTDLGPLPDGATLTCPAKPAPTADELAAEVRVERDRRITATDSMMLSDYTVHDLPLTDEQREELIAYRAALKSLPKQSGFPWNGPDDPVCPWPTLPSFASGNRALRMSLSTPISANKTKEV